MAGNIVVCTNGLVAPSNDEVKFFLVIILFLECLCVTDANWLFIRVRK